MSFEKLTLQQRVSAANIDCMRHPAFCQFTAYIAMGKSEVQTGVKTACTNGRDKLYGADFIKPLNRKQMRYLVMHENLHVALRHCTGYKAVSRKYPKLANVAKDYVVNGIIEELDPNFMFVERPTPTILINPKLTVVDKEMEEGWEGCLSVPGMRGLVPRYKNLRYQGFDEKGKAIDRTVSGFHARVVQHECDHLAGILYPMRIKDLRNFGFTAELFPGEDIADD